MNIEIDESLPDHFYKFTSAKRAMEIVLNKQLWFSSPKHLNDPFDCNINLIDFQPNEDQIKMFINDKLQGNRQSKREEIKRNKRNAYHIRNQLAVQSDEVFRNSGICCFSGVKDNILLWTHYADNHQGICLKFDKQIAEIATMTGKVQYKDRYDKASFFNQENAIYHLIFTKANDWYYEQEIRAFQLLDFGKMDFEIKLLTEIIFGCKTEINVIQEMKKIVLDLNLSHVKFRHAEQTKNSFKLKFY